MTDATDDEQRQGMIACCGEACIEGVRLTPLPQGESLA